MMLLAILLSLAAGIFLAATGVLPASFESAVSEMPFYCLCLMLFLVGYGIGRDRKTLRSLFRKDFYAFLIPVGTIVGTLMGGVVAGLFLSIGLKECVAVAAGFGWYSFSAVYLAEVHSADLGAVAFLSNVFRELMALFMIPLVVRIAGPYPAVSIGGATTMDVTLPVITHYAGSQTAIIAFIHGVVLSTLTPFLLPLIMSL